MDPCEKNFKFLAKKDPARLIEWMKDLHEEGFADSVTNNMSFKDSSSIVKELIKMLKQ